MRADEIRHTRRKAVRAMKSFQARVGGFYVNESKGLVREITQQTPNGKSLLAGIRSPDRQPDGRFPRVLTRADCPMGGP